MDARSALDCLTLANFHAYTDQHWSVQGYSSAGEMRRLLDPD